MTSVRLDHISQRFEATLALDNVCLEIAAGELFFLLGPSGCGKSTLLRLIAGLYLPSAGRIFFNDRDVTDVGTARRNAVMCFQSYALWPHMTVRENVRFGLNIRGMSRHEQRERVEEVLRIVQMQEYADRKPNQLSGGQQQRVALARALAVRPDCLLLDEPLSNLDAKLRQEMRGEIRRICKSTGHTTIYVTHDQKEALSVADRIAVMKDGRIVQVGTPAELYHQPCDSFVAGFIGQTNLLRGRVVERNGSRVRIDTDAGAIWAIARSDVPEQVIVSIRPEQMRVRVGGFGVQPAVSGVEPGSGFSDVRNQGNVLVGRTMETTFLGDASEHVLDVNGQRLTVVSTPPVFSPPAEMTVEFAPDDVVLLTQ